MKKRYFILFIFLFIICTAVNAEDDYKLKEEIADASCPTLWSEVKSVGTISKEQIVSSDTIISNVEAPSFFTTDHNGFVNLTLGSYDVNYYTATKDENGNIKYEKYEPTEKYCSYYTEGSKTGKYLYLASVRPENEDYELEKFTILPKVNGKEVKWRYVSETEGTMETFDLNTATDKQKAYVEEKRKTLANYIKKLKEKDIYTIQVYSTYVYNSKTEEYERNSSNNINFFEVIDEETNLTLTCNNSKKNNYACSLSLDYDYIANNIKVSMAGTKAELNDFAVKGVWKVTEEDNSKMLEYNNSKVEYEFTDGAEIASFNFNYDGDNPKEYIENNISAKVTSLTNNLGTFTKDEITSNISYIAQKNNFSIEAITNPNTASDAIIYSLLVFFIILLVIILILLNKTKLSKLNKLN